jgi:hypothetical protein
MITVREGRFESGGCSQRVYSFRKENQLIVLKYEHA